MYNYKIELSYDGTDFFGWQETAFGNSVEGFLKQALQKILQENIMIQAASRTDRGVHAKAQVVNFFLKKQCDTFALKRGLNALLPSTIRVHTIEEMALSFHPTMDATLKEYHYHITLGPFQNPIDRLYAWHIIKPLNIKKIEGAIPYFLQEKDFSSFCNMRKDIEKTPKITQITDISLDLKGEKLIFIVSGKRFLYKMVRNVVGTLVGVGEERIDLPEIPLIFEKKERKWAGLTAPAHGLFLMKVYY